jgi:hypothetical protein
MACKVCHRQGLCTECCCISTDHTDTARRALPNLVECRLCKHPILKDPR